MNKFRNAILAAAAILPAVCANAYAQSKPEFVTFGGALFAQGPNAAMFRPDNGKAHIAIILMHRTADTKFAPACKELSKRGIAVLCMSPTSVNNESIVKWDQTMLDMAAGVKYLRAQPGIDTILLFGHSGGGSVMSSYQAVAEKGLAYCNTPEKISPCSDKVAHLPPADGVILVDGHPGDAMMKMRDYNPSVITNPDGSVHIQADLDPFSPANGYSPAGSHYSKDFQQRYTKAQAAFIAKLTDRAKKNLAAIKSGGMTRAGEDMIEVVTTKESGWLSRYDKSLAGARETLHPAKLLKNDGTVVTQLVTSVGLDHGRGSAATTPAEMKALKTEYYTDQTFLEAHSIRAVESQRNIDVCSTNYSTICGVKSFTAPLLITPMGAYLFIGDSEAAYDTSISKDKEIVVIEGALHPIDPCKECETTPGQYGNTVKNFFDYVAKWANTRFPS